MKEYQYSSENNSHFFLKRVELWQIEAEQGKYDVLREQLQKDEEELQMQYQEEREVRIWKEKITALQAEGTRRTREK